jgi:hypothetical protein
MIQARESKNTPPPASWAAEDELVGGGAVPAVVDGLVDVGEADLGEAGRRQDVLHDGRIGEGERMLAARGRSGCRGPAGDGLADRGTG